MGEHLAAADSFRVSVRDGIAQVRGLDRHLKRFASAVRENGLVDARDLQEFLRHALTEIAQFGSGFPRLEYVEGGTMPRLHVSLRPLPTLTGELDLVSAPNFPLVNPATKGPNIARLAELAGRLGAEPLLCDDGGLVREGATTSLLYWRGDTPVTVARADRVPSIAEALVIEQLALSGATVSREEVTRDQLQSHEVWALNALHGIRIVRSIDGRPLPHAEPLRLAKMRDTLDTTWQPVADAPLSL